MRSFWHSPEDVQSSGSQCGLWGKKIEFKNHSKTFKIVAGTDNPFEFHAQLWKFENGQLINKLRNWRCGGCDKNATIDSDGIIEVHEERKVISINGKTNKVEYEIKDSPPVIRQSGFSSKYPLPALIP